MTDFKEITGRKFKIIYKSYNDYILNTKITDYNCKLNKIEGIIENFRPSAEVVINSEIHGFNIIPYKSIVYMLEIKKV